MAFIASLQAQGNAGWPMKGRKTPDFLYVPEAITEKALLLPLYNEAAGVPGVCVRQE